MVYQASLRGIGVGVGVGGGGAGAPAVLLEARDEIVPIFVSPGQAQAIEQARQGMPSERPLTHDLLVKLLTDLDARLDRVRIDDLSDDTFFAKLDLTIQRSERDEKLVRDVRPSDGIALAVRVDCPITIAADVIDEAGLDPDRVGTETSGLGAGGPADTDRGTGFGGRDTESGERDPVDDLDLEEGVDIDIDEPDDTDEDDSEPE